MSEILCEFPDAPVIDVPQDDPGHLDCDCDAISRALQRKQDSLIAGPGIELNGSVISAPGGGSGGTAGVTSFNGRTGGVVPIIGDYNASQIRAQDGRTVQNYIDQYNNNQPDAMMSSTSQKPVQNKVIKSYVDAVDVKTLPPGGSTGDILAKIDGQNYNAHWINGNNFMKKTDYDVNDNGRVDMADKSDALKAGGFSVTAPSVTQNTTVVVQSQVGKPSGVVPLDNNGKILPQYMPDNIMSGLTYGGVFDAATRTVRLTPAAKSILQVTDDTLVLENSSAVPAGYPANAPLFYVTTNGGNFAGMTFDNGDWLMSLETEWQQLKNGTAGVSSVNGMTGAVVMDSDQVPQGTTNLYMTSAEKNKLADIEDRATRDVDVIQTASVTALPDGTQVLRLVNKNGDITSFLGNAAAGDFLTRTGNASETYVVYTPTGERTSFTGGELTGEFARKVVDWLTALESVAFTADYNDLINKPMNVSTFYNDGNGTNPYITRTNADLLNYYLKTEVYTRAEVDNLVSAVGHMNFYVVDQLPDLDIDTGGIYYVPVDPDDPTEGFNRYQYIQGRWVFLGTTDIQFNDYLLKNGDASNVTSSLGVYTTRELLDGNDKLSEALGKINYWLSQMKDICFSADWHDLENADELATQEDLEEYVKKLWPTTEAGKVLGIDPTGEVTTIEMGAIEAIQYDALPAPSSSYAGKVFQHIGDNGTEKTGVWYKCEELTFYGWLQDRTGNHYFTLNENPVQYDILYGEAYEETAERVNTVSGPAMTDLDGDAYTRNTSSDVTQWWWVPLMTKTSDLQNNGNGTGAPKDYFITKQEADDTYNPMLTAGTRLTKVTDTTDITNVNINNDTVTPFTAKVLFEYMWKKIYPVGSVYTTVTTDNPATLFGGSWTHFGQDRVLWGAEAGTAAGSTLSEQLPDIRGHIDWKDGGQAKTEISNGSGAFNLTNKNTGAAYPTGSGSSNAARGFDFRASYYSSTYKLNASVRPAAYTVHFWRRTA